MPKCHTGVIHNFMLYQRVVLSDFLFKLIHYEVVTCYFIWCISVYLRLHNPALFFISNLFLFF